MIGGQWPLEFSGQTVTAQFQTVNYAACGNVADFPTTGREATAAVRRWCLEKKKKKKNRGCLLPWLSKMAQSASVREPCIISWQSHINNKAHHAKCECLCLRKDVQQVHLSSPRLHFVQQRAPLCQRLLSESFGWSFFYVPLPGMHNIHETSW